MAEESTPMSSTSSSHRRDRQRQSPSPLAASTRWAASPSVTNKVVADGTPRERRRSSIPPPLADLRIDSSRSIDTSPPCLPTEPLLSDEGERKLKRRRRSSTVEGDDDTRRIPLKRCNGIATASSSSSVAVGSGGSSNIWGEQQGDDDDDQQHDHHHHHQVSSRVESHDHVMATASSSGTSVSLSSAASGSSSSLVADLDATTLSAPKAISSPSSSSPLPRPQTQPHQHPVFTCPFIPYVQDRQQQAQSQASNSSAVHPLGDYREDRRDSSGSSFNARRDSGWSTSESRRGTMTSGISSPSASTMAVDMIHYADKHELRPFPIDRLPRDIVNLILDHVLGSPEFGQNGRWKDKRGQEEDKIQMVRALKDHASIHLKFALIHRSWTPHVIKSLYRFPRLTSKEAIEKFHWAITNPLSLWGSEMSEDGEVGGVIGPRGRFVRLITYCVGRGRHSATDYLMWSGSWFASTAGAVILKLPNARGWECEGWCSEGCEETRELEIFNPSDEDRVVLRHLSILRSPLPADVLVLTLSTTKDMRALELLDVQKHFLLGDNLDLLKRGLKFTNRIEIFAMKVEGGVEQEGPMDDALEIMPTLRHLSVQADLLSLKFFAKPRTSNLQSILIGLAAAPPVLFHGNAALDTLWAEAQAETIYSQVRQQAQCVFAEGTTFEGSVTHRMSLNSTTVSMDGKPSAGVRPSSSSSMVFHQFSNPETSRSPYTRRVSAEPAMSTVLPQLGLESWLIRELKNSNSAISRASLTGDDALAVYTSYTHHTPI